MVEAAAGDELLIGLDTFGDGCEPEGVRDGDDGGTIAVFLGIARFPR